MNEELTLYFPPDLNIIFVRQPREFIMECVDNIIFRNIISKNKEINYMPNGDVYDRL